MSNLVYILETCHVTGRMTRISYHNSVDNAVSDLWNEKNIPEHVSLSVQLDYDYPNEHEQIHIENKRQLENTPGDKLVRHGDEE